MNSPNDSTQWRDTDGDLFGDNWGNPEWNDTREENWPGIFIEGATSADMCPLEKPDGLFDDPVNYPGCLIEEEGGGTDSSDSSSSGDSSGIGTVVIIGIIAGVVVIALVGAVILMSNKKSKPSKKVVKSQPKPLTDLPPPSAPGPGPLPLGEDVSEHGDVSNDENTVGSWEDLPGGDYLDPDEHGTVWFRANNGDNWYQNSDGTWTKWID